MGIMDKSSLICLVYIFIYIQCALGEIPAKQDAAPVRELKKVKPLPLPTIPPAEKIDAHPTDRMFPTCGNLITPLIDKVYKRVNQLRQARDPPLKRVMRGLTMLKYAYYHAKNAACPTKVDEALTQNCSATLKNYLTSYGTCELPSDTIFSCCNDGKDQTNNCIVESFSVPDVGGYSGTADIVAMKVRDEQLENNAATEQIKTAIRQVFSIGGADADMLKDDKWGFIGAWAAGSYVSIVVGTDAGTACAAPPAKPRRLDGEILKSSRRKLTLNTPHDCGDADRDALGLLYDIVDEVNAGRGKKKLVLSKELFQSAFYHASGHLCGLTPPPLKPAYTPCVPLTGWQKSHCYPAGEPAELRVGCCGYGLRGCEIDKMVKRYVPGWQGEAKEQIMEFPMDTEGEKLMTLIEHLNIQSDTLFMDPNIQELGVFVTKKNEADKKDLTHVISFVGGKTSDLLPSPPNCDPPPTPKPPVKVTSTSPSLRLQYSLGMLVSVLYFILF